MHKMIIFLICFFVLLSCKQPQLENSYILFSQTQPVNVTSVTEFSQKKLGSFTMNYSQRLVIESKKIYFVSIESTVLLKPQFDSIQYLEIRNSQVFDNVKNETYKTVIKGDTITFEKQHFQTLFSFAENETAKEYKSSLILNKKIDGKYVVNIINFNVAGLRYIQLGTENDFDKLNRELKIPYEAIVDQNDTVNVILNPARADFRKLLRLEGFEYESNYYFKNTNP